MDRVVYFLGAGFSAPLGLPAMGNFLYKARDWLGETTEGQKRLSAVEEGIRRFSPALNHTKGDLRNLEEVLSLLQLREHLRNPSALDQWRQDTMAMISDVIEHYTPPFVRSEEPFARAWQHVVFGPNRDIAPYISFAAALLGVDIEEKETQADSPVEERLQVRMAPSDHARYAIITLNYDTVFERAEEYLQKLPGCRDKRRFFKPSAAIDRDWPDSPYFCKLHGCTRDRTIKLPTWNKELDSETCNMWRAAADLMAAAREIRIIGYSLPECDTYVKYLIRLAAAEATNLQRIDVICLDRSGERARYDQLLDFGRTDHQFLNVSVSDYLNRIDDLHIRNLRRNRLSMNLLEDAHRLFVEDQGTLDTNTSLVKER